MVTDPVETTKETVGFPFLVPSCPTFIPTFVGNLSAKSNTIKNTNKNGGEGGIRTLGFCSKTPDFLGFLKIPNASKCKENLS
ncbi:MAG: hypothetical protein KIT22_04760 [Verrucomicrobiae bacterium]|nr:hypothetical protein [Verrucomicrobiae bacterium]